VPEDQSAFPEEGYCLRKLFNIHDFVALHYTVNCVWDTDIQKAKYKNQQLQFMEKYACQQLFFNALLIILFGM
jgi:hypothetical protein